MSVIRKSEVCAIIVTYHPDNGFPERAQLTARQVGTVVIVDNNSGQRTLKVLDALAITDKVHVVRNSANLGIAAALNEGIRLAKSLNYRWILTLDQDTTPEHDLVD